MAVRIDLSLAAPAPASPAGGVPAAQLAPEDLPVYTVTGAARLSGMHPQTLRQYDRLGLVVPQRTAGRGRRYSARNVADLLEVQRLSTQEGVNLAGIGRILALEADNRALRRQVEDLRAAVYPGQRVFAVARTGDAVPLAAGQRPARPVSGAESARALVLWRG
ncbi:MAG: helix-turn-helix transcriptional regulator [Bifidobacteriaceae bacterium]|jgi:MerR family transcriptional regulator/heat shock protein HspR|nr:helix-turn-helix transcriptional regulator [Bifidobacteriaceae bacterium]